MAMAAALDHAVFASPWSSNKLSTAFYEVKCAQGFQCVSKMGFFGRGHDGDIELPFDPPELTKDELNAYEVGCPARGKMNAGGLCVDDLQGGKGGLCYSTKRYEAGDGMPCNSKEKCFCARVYSSSGMGDDNKGTRLFNGAEIRYGKFDTEPASACDECSQHDCDKNMCNSCKNCEYMTKEIEVPDADGKFSQRRQEGCFERLGQPKKEHPYWYPKTIEKELEIVPHYKLWNPQEPPEDDVEDGSFRLPFQSRREPLGRDEWRTQYKDAAPAVQKLMDILVMKMIDGTKTTPAWSPMVDERAGYRGLQLEKCWTRVGSGDAIADKIDKFLAAQKSCKYMQETAQQIAPGITFSAQAKGTPSCGAYYYDEVSKVRTCGCFKGTGTESAVCKSLNCYNDREDILRAVNMIKQKLKICAGATNLNLAETHDYGPEPKGSTEVQLAGTIQNPDVSQGVAPMSPEILASFLAVASRRVNPRRRRGVIFRNFLSVSE